MILLTQCVIDLVQQPFEISVIGANAGQMSATTVNAALGKLKGKVAVARVRNVPRWHEMGDDR